MAALHIHPRAAEIFLVLSGRVITEMIPEGGVLDASGKAPRVIRTELRANQTTIFPQGSFHAQFNPDCTPAVALAAFSSDDPGAALIVPQVFEQTDDFVLGAFGGEISKEELEKFREAVPKGAFYEVEECKKRCGL
jgi:oxalate decarboxylase/phosphoglucose isomerase-like protein (cupin superfamily)